MAAYFGGNRSLDRVFPGVVLFGPRPATTLRLHSLSNTISTMSFKKAFQTKDFVVTAELPLKPDSSRKTLLCDAQRLGDGIDGILLTDNQYGQPHMTPLAAANILQSGDYNPILQLSCRNRNRVALLGELLGARALGVDSLLLIRGGALPEGFQPRPMAVTDTDAKDLIASARMIDDDEGVNGGSDFLIATSAAVHDPAPDWIPEELMAKATSGAQLVFTQICVDVNILRRYMAALISQKLLQRLSVIVSVAVMTSPEIAAWFREHRRGTLIPPDWVDRFTSGTFTSSDGINLCGKLVADIATIPGVSGVNFVVSEDIDAIPQVLEVAGIKRPHQ